MKRAANGDRNCLPDVQTLLTDPEVGSGHRRCFGSPVERLRRRIVEKTVGKNVIGGEAIEQGLDRMRAELEGPNPTPIERLLAEQASFCWFIVHWYENQRANSSGWTIVQADLQQRKIDKAHARFLSAVRTLAQVRKLAVPTLQLNIAKNQVNVGTIPS